MGKQFDMLLDYTLKTSYEQRGKKMNISYVFKVVCPGYNSKEEKNIKK